MARLVQNCPRFTVDNHTHTHTHTTLTNTHKHDNNHQNQYTMARLAQRGGRGYYVGGRGRRGGRGSVGGRNLPVGGRVVEGRGHEEVIGVVAGQQHDAAQDAARVVLFDEKAMLRWGLSLVGFPNFRQVGVSDATNTRRFRAHFGVGAKALSKLYADLATIMPKIDIKDFFLALSWLKLYETENVLAGRWTLSEKTIRNTCRSYVQKIQQLKESKVLWGEFEDDEVYIISVDGVHCRMQEVRRDPGSKWYTHKHNSAGVSYELGIAIRRNQLVWINGPFPASRHDITTFRSANEPANGLKAKIPDGKRAIGDSGYKGEPNKVSITRENHSDDVKEYFGRVKSRHETFNARLKGFKALDTAFRHGFHQHKQVFESVCIAVQYDIETGHGLFQV